MNSYSKAGVDVKKAEDALVSVKNLILSTYNKAVISPENGFAALYEIANGQVLASATDGVGTKLDIAISMRKHSTIGIDLVAMIINDLAVYGIKPLFFLDYLATSKIEPEIFAEVVQGIVDGCNQAGCVLIGGETAEMPGFYPDDKYDLAGFAVGLANKDDVITGSNIAPGDIVIGLASSGLHSNGYSLVRKIINDNNLLFTQSFKDRTLGEALLEPTIIYSSLIQAIISKAHIKGAAHITGGGFANISRVLPSGVKVTIEKDSWPRPDIYPFIQQQGKLEEAEMFDIFNMGIGMVLVAEKDAAEKILNVAKDNNHKAYVIGKVEAGNKEVVVE